MRMMINVVNKVITTLITTFIFRYFYFWNIKILCIHLQKGFSFWRTKSPDPPKALFPEKCLNLTHIIYLLYYSLCINRTGIRSYQCNFVPNFINRLKQVTWLVVTCHRDPSVVTTTVQCMSFTYLAPTLHQLYFSSSSVVSRTVCACMHYACIRRSGIILTPGYPCAKFQFFDHMWWCMPLCGRFGSPYGRVVVVAF